MAGIIIRIWTKDKAHVVLKAVECPSGRIPEEVAAENGGELDNFYSSLADARFALASAPTGTADFI